MSKENAKGKKPARLTPSEMIIFREKLKDFRAKNSLSGDKLAKLLYDKHITKKLLSRKSVNDWYKTSHISRNIYEPLAEVFPELKVPDIEPYPESNETIDTLNECAQEYAQNIKNKLPEEVLDTYNIVIKINLERKSPDTQKTPKTPK